MPSPTGDQRFAAYPVRASSMSLGHILVHRDLPHPIPPCVQSGPRTWGHGNRPRNELLEAPFCVIVCVSDLPLGQVMEEGRDPSEPDTSLHLARRYIRILNPHAVF